MNSRNQLSALAKWFTAKQLISLTKQPVLLPFYHTVSDEFLPHISHLYPLRNTKLFEQDLDFFCAEFQSVSIEKLLAITEKNSVLKPVFHLTFDDGLSEIYSVIAPLLEQRGISATFFVNTGFIDNKDLFYRYKISLIIDVLKKNSKLVSVVRQHLNSSDDVVKSLLQLKIQDTPLIEQIAVLCEINFTNFLAKTKPYLTSSQIEDLIKRGFSIGSHSVSHPLFSAISWEEQQRQIIESFDFLNRNFGIKNRFFAFPFTDNDVSATFISWMHENQHCKLTFGTAGLKHDFSKYHLQRTPLEGTSESAETRIKSEYLYYALKAVAGRNTIKRR